MVVENVACLMESMVKQEASMEMLGGMSQTCPFCGEMQYEDENKDAKK